MMFALHRVACISFDMLRTRVPFRFAFAQSFTFIWSHILLAYERFFCKSCWMVLGAERRTRT